MKKIIKLFVILFALLLVLAPISSVFASPSRVVDNADILSENERILVLAELDNISEKYNCDVVIVTVNSTNGKTLEAFADDYFDYNGYGLGDQKSGILMLIDMDSRTIWFSTQGYAIYAFTDYGIYLLEDTVIDSLIEGYYQGCMKFAEEAERYLNLAKNGSPIDIAPEPEPQQQEYTPNAFVSLGLGGIISLISSLVAKGKNKSVSKKTTAKDYKRAGSFHVTEANQWFLYSNVSRTRIERHEDHGGGHSSGGSSTHISSSGHTHGGGGGNRHF